MTNTETLSEILRSSQFAAMLQQGVENALWATANGFQEGDEVSLVFQDSEDRALYFDDRGNGSADIPERITNDDIVIAVQYRLVDIDRRDAPMHDPSSRIQSRVMDGTMNDDAVQLDVYVPVRDGEETTYERKHRAQDGTVLPSTYETVIRSLRGLTTEDVDADPSGTVERFVDDPLRVQINLEQWTTGSYREGHITLHPERVGAIHVPDIRGDYARQNR